tara:strand:- start:2912 stop:3142 length:231 start_codon:yes stop_codon:yes gene_type:complete
MAKGTAAKSASGASMSKYDVEVEKRLTAIESDIKSIELSIANIEKTVQAHSHDSNDSGDVASELADLKKKVESMWD